MTIKIYNTLTRKKEEFQPLKKGKVGMYVCGPTVYDRGHLGHAYAAVSMDLIRRYLMYKGFKVTYVSNITDVEDKMIKRAARENITEAELAEKIIPLYTADYAALNVLPSDHQPRATQYIKQMVVLIEKLLKKHVAYEAQDGIYFEVGKFAEYGKLSRQKLDELRAGARVEVDESKKNPEDFALWKKAKPGEPDWEGPNGMRGRPGWHIECSAMSMDLLGKTFDMHGGGADLIFPHHEDEIAQSEMATGKPFVHYWVHNGHIRVDGEKMSKSLGNFFTIEEIFAKYNPLVVRYFLISNHYRNPVDFNDGLLESAKQSLGRLHDFVRRLKTYAAPADANLGHIQMFVEKARKAFEEAMDDDFESSRALAAVFEFVREMNILLDKKSLTSEERNAALQFIRKIDTVLAVLPKENDDGLDEEIEELIVERKQARANKDFARSDAIRDELKKRGIELEDGPEGTMWKRVL
ncbi:cysteine--tRNA ligase [Candidatus Peregrinibacteria bacterium CG11_big_fil_rev_8_21_14_0_20_46_8]|nr:MAG: cysteine--tRNA ligase [Candidatus Peregrinibacteria bacterium CG11_big_fil_rev_8_21_14_0_20_46_8]